MHRSTYGQQVAENRGQIVPLDGNLGCEVARAAADRSCAIQHFEVEMDGLLVRGCNQIIDEQGAIVGTRIVASFVKLAVGAIGGQGGGVNRCAVGCRLADSVTGEGVETCEAGAIVVRDLEIVRFDNEVI